MQFFNIFIYKLSRKWKVTTTIEIPIECTESEVKESETERGKSLYKIKLKWLTFRITTTTSWEKRLSWSASHHEQTVNFLHIQCAVILHTFSQRASFTFFLQLTHSILLSFISFCCFFSHSHRWINRKLYSTPSEKLW